MAEGNGGGALTAPQPTTQDRAELLLSSSEASKPSVPLDQLLAALPDTASRDAFVRVLVEAEAARQKYELDLRQARVYALSGKFDDLKGSTPTQSVAAAMMKLQLGRSWGLEPADALQHIYFTNGKPAIQNEILAAKMLDAGIGWDIQWQHVQDQHKGQPWKRCTGCTLWLKVRTSDPQMPWAPMLDRNGEQVSVSFLEADADHAKIWENGKEKALSDKWNFKAWPADMYFWKAIARVRKYYATNVLRGAAFVRAEAVDVPLEEDESTIAALPEGTPEEVVEEVPAVQQTPESLRSQVLRQAELMDTRPDRDYPE